MQWLKLIHVSCVVLSFSGFFLRGMWMMFLPDKLQNKWVKIFPHIIDSSLLVSALLMLYVAGWSVFEHSWLQAKIFALFIYIVLGSIALKWGKRKSVRVISWVSGLLVFFYIVSVALTKNAVGFLGFI